VPHAGYRYSGPIAAVAYAHLRSAARPVHRVAIVGPAHYARVWGCVAPAADRWRTPLGSVPIDVSTRDALVRAGLATVDDAPFVPEHSQEVQLPFLQRILPRDTPVLPIVAGPSTVEQVALVWAALAAAEPAGVLLCSTDLSHYETHQAAQAQDAGTVRAIRELDPDAVGVRDACGVYALRGLLGWARQTGRGVTILDQRTSADTAGSPDRVVGYCAAAVTAPG
jgi:AmmeMemoRadiSam system protein B